jgi:hypothetical protein
MQNDPDACHYSWTILHDPKPSNYSRSPLKQSMGKFPVLEVMPLHADQIRNISGNHPD